MHLKYFHYFGNESNESILEAYGLKPKFEEIDKMKPRQCPNCNELNKIDSNSVSNAGWYYLTTLIRKQSRKQ